MIINSENSVYIKKKNIIIYKNKTTSKTQQNLQLLYEI